MKMVADKIIMHAPKRLFHAWLQGTPYTCQGVEILTVLGQTLWNKILAAYVSEPSLASSLLRSSAASGLSPSR